MYIYKIIKYVLYSRLTYFFPPLCITIPLPPSRYPFIALVFPPSFSVLLFPVSRGCWMTARDAINAGTMTMITVTTTTSQPPRILRTLRQR